MCAATVWPDLSYPLWRDTAATLQLWTQIVGKVRLMLTPWVNHSWQVPFYVTACGLGTSPIPAGTEIFEIEFDFLSHRLVARTSRGEKETIPLEPRTVRPVQPHDLLRWAGRGVRVRRLAAGDDVNGLAESDRRDAEALTTPPRVAVFSLGGTIAMTPMSQKAASSASALRSLVGSILANVRTGTSAARRDVSNRFGRNVKICPLAPGESVHERVLVTVRGRSAQSISWLSSMRLSAAATSVKVS